MDDYIVKYRTRLYYNFFNNYTHHNWRIWKLTSTRSAKTVFHNSSKYTHKNTKNYCLHLKFNNTLILPIIKIKYLANRHERKKPLPMV